MFFLIFFLRVTGKPDPARVRELFGVGGRGQFGFRSRCSVPPLSLLSRSLPPPAFYLWTFLDGREFPHWRKPPNRKYTVSLLLAML